KVQRVGQQWEFFLQRSVGRIYSWCFKSCTSFIFAVDQTEAKAFSPLCFSSNFISQVRVSDPKYFFQSRSKVGLNHFEFAGGLGHCVWKIINYVSGQADVLGQGINHAHASDVRGPIASSVAN